MRPQLGQSVVWPAVLMLCALATQSFTSTVPVDPNYETDASGTITVLLLSSQFYGMDGTIMKALQDQWGASNNIQITRRIFDPDQNYTDYVNQIMSACSFAESSFFDVVYVDVSYIGLLQNCLLNMTAWNSSLGQGHHPVAFGNNVNNNSLYALPAEMDMGLLYWNEDILYRHSMKGPPIDLNDMENMAGYALKNERALENYVLTGLVGQFGISDSAFCNFLEWIWIAGVDTLMDSYGNFSIATSHIAAVVSQVASWTDSFIIDPTNTDGMDEGAAFDSWIRGNSIFMRNWASYLLAAADQAPFQWGAGPMVNSNVSDGGSGTLGGWAVGVYRYSTNPGAALKFAEFVSSQDYQRKLSINLGRHPIPTYPNLYNDSDVCKNYPNNACETFASINLIRRPSIETGVNYTNVSTVISTAVSNILHGAYVTQTLLDLDAEVLRILGKPPRNATLTVDPNTARPGKRVPSDIVVQTSGLFCVIFVVMTAAGIYKYNANKKAQEIKKAEEDKFKELEEDHPDGPEVEQRGPHDHESDFDDGDDYHKYEDVTDKTRLV
ncbi:uncharacterized protein BJ171DRAFT_636133 [Polychytrium aggregatum]|uniref:uncharacterized protein n=1 Tax=Polychytrium aggregatum TaxID=110093 RepID=UPI0022FE5C21|nr:uncharacterized protein BJ171DRAFT_636133 [Polychytrium aggregatum]KAI9207815.1 hypothetical protein BJ171DRAFT_636133 [Polychytrium aggregatum]